MDARTEEAKHYHKHYKNLILSTLYEVDQDDNPTIVQKYMLAMSDVRELEELLNELHLLQKFTEILKFNHPNHATKDSAYF